MRALVIEDDLAVAHFLEKGFREEGWEIQRASNGHEGLSLAMQVPFDVIVLDILLPGLHGLEVLRRIRQQGIKSPVLILTALDEKEDVVKGLDLGADDYLVKPFFFAELLARVRAILRRSQSPLPSVLKVADLSLDPARRKVKRAGNRIDLTAKEFTLLEYFMRHAGQVLTRVMILESVFDYHFEGMSNVVDVHVYKLRNVERIRSCPAMDERRWAGLNVDYILAGHPREYGRTQIGHTVLLVSGGGGGTLRLVHPDNFYHALIIRTVGDQIAEELVVVREPLAPLSRLHRAAVVGISSLLALVREDVGIGKRWSGGHGVSTAEVSSRFARVSQSR